MTSDQLASMYAEVVRGVPVEESRHAKSAADRTAYAVLEAEVAELRRRNPDAQFDIPAEVQAATPEQ